MGCEAEVDCNYNLVTERYMYNKLFSKILDSSIWLAPDPHRLVWVTLLAVMDEDGNAFFACADNLAARARVTVEQAELAIAMFEAPDPKSGDPENEGRRIERFPGGWFVLNAHKYRAIVTKAIARERTRERVAKHRARGLIVTVGNDEVTTSNVRVTPSESESESESEAEKTKKPKKPLALANARLVVGLNIEALDAWIAYRAERKPEIKNASLVACAEQLAAFGAEQQNVVKHSIANGYQGLFAPKANGFVGKKSMWVTPMTVEQAEAQARERGELV